jgi:small subunit ribosomal protein S14
MAKTSSIERNEKRVRLNKKYKARHDALVAIIHNPNSTAQEIFDAVLKLQKLPRNSSAVRIHNRCELTGRPRGNYRRFKLSRIKIRELASEGQIPGATKSSW